MRLRSSRHAAASAVVLVLIAAPAFAGDPFSNLADTITSAGARWAPALMVVFTVLYALEAAFGLLSLPFQSWAFLAEIGIAALAAMGLGAAERFDDEHLVPAVLAYYLSGRGAVLYSGAAAERFTGHPLEE